jgi:hypothetical protein
MARPIRSIEIYLPLEFNDGRLIPESKYVSVEDELLSRYGGVTAIQREFPLRGVWVTGDEVYRDKVVVFSVMDFRNETRLDSLRYLERLKSRLKKKFDQLEILITVADLLAI